MVRVRTREVEKQLLHSIRAGPAHAAPRYILRGRLARRYRESAAVQPAPRTVKLRCPTARRSRPAQPRERG